MPAVQLVMGKLSRDEVLKKVEKWAGLTKKIGELEAAKAAELAPVLELNAKRLAPIEAKHAALIDPVDDQAFALQTEILEWLASQKKSVRVESKRAVAEFVKGKKLGNRIVNAEKFVARCIERKIKDFWKLVSVTIKNAETVMGKDDMTEICEQPTVDSEIATLELK